MKTSILFLLLFLTVTIFSQDFQVSNTGIYSVAVPHVAIDGSNAHIVYGTNLSYYKFDVNGISTPIDAAISPATAYGPNTTDIAVNPTNSEQIAIIYNDYHYDSYTSVSFYGCYIVKSMDGGKNWETPTLLDTIMYGNSLDNILHYIPQVEYSNSGNLYALWRVHSNGVDTNAVFLKINDNAQIRIDDPSSNALELALALTVETQANNSDWVALSYGKMEESKAKFYVRYSYDSGETISDIKLVKDDGETFLTIDHLTKAFLDEAGVIKYIYSDFSHGPKLSISNNYGDTWQDAGTVESHKYVYVAIGRISPNYYVKLFLNDAHALVFYVSSDLLNWQEGGKISANNASIDYAGSYIELKCDVENEFLTTAWIDNRTGNSEIFYGKADLPELVGVKSNNEIPTEFVLQQNYPNPFNPTTTISFALPQQANVTITVYNSLGEEVAELINREMNAGFQSVNFDASNLSSGLYFYKIDAGNFVDVKKMLLIK